MARKPRTTKAQPTSSNKLLEALQFLSLITRPTGAPNETHIILANQTAVTYNGIMAAGVLIEESIFGCPHNSTLIAALSKCGQNLSITQLEGNRISIKSDKFKAIVPGLEPHAIQSIEPDIAQVEIDDKLKTAMEIGNILSENGQTIYNVSILMNGPSIISTNGKVLIEYWHGLNLPNGVAVPRAFAETLSKVSKPITKFGMGPYSVTIYFNDNSWIKTHLYSEQWPDMSHILEGSSNPYPLPNSFWEALGAVAPFSVEGLAYFDQNVLRSHASQDAGASFEIEGLPRGPILNIKQMLMVKPYIQTIDWFARTNNGLPMMKFFGNQCRGAIAGRNDG